jgi:hypothetical protein
VLDTPPPGQMGRYIALSHCWGKEQLITTTQATFWDRVSGIPLDSLPKTFQDAVQLTRRLKIRYLWIDSLCIIQDSASDWKKEAALMDSVYSNALFTVSADSASDSSKGLSCPNREQLDSSPLRISSPDLYVRRAPREDHLGLCHKVSKADDPNPRINQNPFLQLAAKVKTAGNAAGAANVDPSRIDHLNALNPLNSRAWTFQERMLSSRVLHYCETELVWECDTTIRCECQPDPRPPSNRPLRGPADAAALLGLWRRVVEEYSTRKLTKFSDRLPALAGLAKKAASVWGVTYLAGIWREHLPAGLV